MTRPPRRLRAVLLMALIVAALPAGPAAAQASREEPAADSGGDGSGAIVPFTSDRWVMRGAQIVEHLGRECLMGFAYLEDVSLQDGVIEVDVAVTWDRTYPGIIFRMQSESDYERFYVRPHRSKFYADVLQYTPVMNGIAGWQLYHGEGFTNEAIIPTDEWFRLRIEVQGNRAQVYYGDDAEPDLQITDLKHGVGSGAVGVMGPVDGTAYFSDFRYWATEDLKFPLSPVVDPPPGLITDWEISQVFPMSELELETPLREQGLPEIEWQAVTGEVSGLVDIARWEGRRGREPDCVLARTTIPATEPRTMVLRFGYSDLVSVFLNDEHLFLGSSAYRQRDPSFLGIVGLFDSVPLGLRAGENELLLIVAESFGGWGFICQDGEALFQSDALVQEGETGSELLMPESVVYDAQRACLYVSNFDGYGRAAGGQFISRLTPDGDIETREWVSGLSRPTGMVLWEDTLAVVERGALAMIHIPSAEVVARHPIPGAQFPNDVARGPDGEFYVTDSAGNKIHRMIGDGFSEWLMGAEVGDPNALYVDGQRLLVGNSADNCLKAIDLRTEEITTVARFAPGFIDGIRPAANGDLIVSQWQGRVYRVSPAGARHKLLDTTVIGTNTADFEYLPETGRLYIPTFRGDGVVVYRLRG